MFTRLFKNLFARQSADANIDSRTRQARQCYESGDLAGAEQFFQRILAADRNDPGAHHILGRIYGQLGSHDRAARHLEQALSALSDSSDVLCDLGNVFKLKGDREQAVTYYQRAIESEPSNALAYYNLGLTFNELGRTGDAIPSLERAIALQPNLYPAHIEIGTILADEGKFEEAIGHFHEVLRYEPGYSSAYYNLGLTYRLQGRYGDAGQMLRHALRIEPKFMAAVSSLGVVLGDQGRYEEAMACYEKVLAAQPDYDEALWNLAITRLVMGDFARGWWDYEKRWLRRTAKARPFSFPRWEGQPLEGRTLLVYGEQGLGDEIMFASCLPDVMALGGRCVVECDPRLAPIFERSFPEVVVHGRSSMDDVSWVAGVGSIDVQIPMGSLPLHFRQSLADFPKHQGYLKADPARSAYWKARLAGLGPGLKVGISWRGGKVLTRTLLRSVDLETWLPILRLKGMEFVSLQYTPCEEELVQFQQAHGIAVHHWQEAIDDYDETAALVSALDLVVSVCTSVVSLGGALGLPVWVLVPLSPGWIFQREGERMPWFPSVRLFRQEQVNDWRTVIQRVAEELTEIQGQRA